MVTNVEQFLLWERSTRDTIDFKKVYVDIAGDLAAGLALSEIVYWHLPSRDGSSKLKVSHEGTDWIACRRYEWWDRTRLSPKQADRALGILEDAGLIAKDIFKFDGDPTCHVSLIWDRFLPALKEMLESVPENPYLPLGKSVIPQRSITKSTFGEIPVTESTTEVTTEVKEITRPSVGAAAQTGMKTFAAAEPSPAEVKPVKLKTQPALALKIANYVFDIPNIAKGKLALIVDQCRRYEEDQIYARWIDTMFLPSKVKIGDNGKKTPLVSMDNLLAMLIAEEGFAEYQRIQMVNVSSSVDESIFEGFESL